MKSLKVSLLKPLKLVNMYHEKKGFVNGRNIWDSICLTSEAIKILNN